METVRGSVTIFRTPREVYTYWRDLEQLPTFMTHLQSVQPLPDGRWRWTAKAPVGESVQWDAEIVEEEPGRSIAWRSVEGSDVTNVGQVAFTEAPGGRGTEGRGEIACAAPGGAVGRVVAKVLGENPQQQVDDDLRRLKQVIETGEVLLSAGSPEGTRARRQASQLPAQPQDVTETAETTEEARA